MSRVNRTSSPFPRWRNSSCSSGPRTPQASQPMVHRNSFKHTAPSSANHHQRQSPVPSQRLRFPADVARQRSSFQAVSSLLPRNSRLQPQPSPSSKNQKSFEDVSVSKTYYKHLRDTTTRPASPQKKFQTVLKNNKTKLFYAGVKRSPDRKDFMDFLPAKQQKMNMEERHDVPYQSRSSQFRSSNVLWCAPPCRQRSESREKKLDSVHHGSHIEKQCQDRGSTLNQRRGNMNLKTSCQNYDGQVSGRKSSRGQHPTSWRQFPSDKLSDNLERNFPCAGVQHSSPRVQSESGEHTMHHLEQRNSSESLNRKTVRNSKLGDQSSNLPYKQRYRNEVSSSLNLRHHNDHHQRQKSPTTDDQCLQDNHRSQRTSFSSERNSCHQTKTRKLQRRQGSYGRKLRDNTHQESNNLASSRRSSSIESFSQTDRSWPDIMPREHSRSQSLSSVSSRSHSVDKGTDNQSDRSVKGDRSVNSPCANSGVKAKVLGFNPDYVVIIRRTNEGARPLCKREEFSGKCYSSDKSTSSLLVPVDLRQKDDRPSSDYSPDGKESSIKSTQDMYKLAEKADKMMNAKPITATFHKQSRTVTNTNPTLTKKDVADERFVRTRPDSFGQQRCREQTDHASKSAEEESSLTSKKSAFDLRQKIAERRQMGTGRNTSTRIVRSQPHRWRNLPQTRFRNLVFGSRATERKHSFGPWKTEPKRSVMLK